jgi:hypothetical protein
MYAKYSEAASCCCIVVVVIALQRFFKVLRCWYVEVFVLFQVVDDDVDGFLCSSCVKEQ